MIKKRNGNFGSEKLCEPIENLKNLYRETVLPLENITKFSHFSSPSLNDNDFDAKPIVLCIGHYSTGKTSFIKHIIERDFPGIRIGPEPTTDRFIAIMYGESERSIPGNTVAAQIDKPFEGLKIFGMDFLNKFECSELNCPILKKISLVDTPGVLSGSEQSKERQYEFSSVIKWFAERADRILVFFDADKLDISDEMKQTLLALKGNDDKIRCILNKADAVNNQQLMRVYGALMWSLGKVIKSPEVPRIYIGSFWSQPYKNTDNADLFEAEENDLFADLRSLPRNAMVRKFNEFVKRSKKIKIHCLLIFHLKQKLGFFYKNKKQKKMLDNLKEEFKEVIHNSNLSPGDFPDVWEFKKKLAKLELSRFGKISKGDIEKLDHVLSVDVPKLLAELSTSEEDETMLVDRGKNPFDNENESNRCENRDGITFKQTDWVVSGTMKSKFDSLFDRISEGNNVIPGRKAKELMFDSQLSLEDLRKIWEWSDIDKDFNLDRDEFLLCMFLCEYFQNGHGDDLGEKLPLKFIPPSKRLL